MNENEIEEAATIARETFNGPGYAGKVAWVAVATAMKSFWASHAEPEMGLPEVLRKAAEYIDANWSAHYGKTAVERLNSEADRLDADSQQGERDVRIGRAVWSLGRNSTMKHDGPYEGDEHMRQLGAAVREAVETEK